MIPWKNLCKKPSYCYCTALNRGARLGKQATGFLRQSLTVYLPEELDAQLDTAKAMGQEMETLRRDITEHLRKDAFPPLEPTDILMLLRAQELLVCSVFHSLEQLALAQATELRRDIPAIGDLLSRGGDLLCQATAELEEFRRSHFLRPALAQLRGLEHEANTLLRKAMQELFTGESDPMTVFKWSRVYDSLHRCFFRCANAASALELLVTVNQ